MLGSGIWSARPGRDGAGDGDDVHDVCSRRALERREEGAEAPDAPEVVRPRHLLDPIGRDREEPSAARHSRVVDEQMDRRVALRDPTRDLLDLRAIADVALLGLAAELRGRLLEPLAPARDEDAEPAAPRQLARERGPDPARSPGYDGDANTRRVVALISTVSSIGSA